MPPVRHRVPRPAVTLRHRGAAALLLLLGACGDAGARRGEAAPPAGTAAAAAPAGSAGPAAPPAVGRAGGDSIVGHDSAIAFDPADSVVVPTNPGGDLRDPDAIVRALYVNRFAAQSVRKMAKLVGFADATEVNALVIDMKDEFGLNYASRDPQVARNAGAAAKVRDVRALLDTLKAHGIMPIARLVVFKDSVAARANPDAVIRKADGSAWRDRQGLTWVNPYSPKIQEYNLKVAEELVRLGFQEIQWDYIRFPEPYRSLPAQQFPNSDGVSKADALAAFLSTAKTRLNALGVRSTADVFGLVTTINGPLEIGQHWEKLAPAADVLLPMVYPSHYPRGAFGVARPNADPYTIVHRAISRARERDRALGIAGEHVRPYLQAFTLGQPPYGAEEVRQQIRAVHDAGVEGWVLWHPGSTYDPFIPALERELRPKVKQ